MTPFLKLTIFNIIALIIVATVLFLCKKLVKTDKTRDLILKVAAILVVIIHYSAVYVEFFQNEGVAHAYDIYILPIYPCHIFIWLLVIVAFSRNKESRFYKGLIDFVVMVGGPSGLIGALFNVNFLNSDNPTFLDFFLLKGIVSHMVMLFGIVYLIVFDYFKPRLERTMVSVTIGFLSFVVIGFIINTLFAKFNIPFVNAMFLVEPPFPEYPFINFLTIGILALILLFIILIIYENFAFPKEERWLTKVTNKLNNKQKEKEEDEHV